MFALCVYVTDGAAQDSAPIVAVARLLATLCCLPFPPWSYTFNFVDTVHPKSAGAEGEAHARHSVVPNLLSFLADDDIEALPASIRVW